MFHVPMNYFSFRPNGTNFIHLELSKALNYNILGTPSICEIIIFRPHVISSLAPMGLRTLSLYLRSLSQLMPSFMSLPTTGNKADGTVS